MILEFDQRVCRDGGFDLLKSPLDSGNAFVTGKVTFIVLFDNDLTKAFDIHFEMENKVSVKLEEPNEACDITDEGRWLPILEELHFRLCGSTTIAADVLHT